MANKEYEQYLDILRVDYCAYVQYVHEGRWTPSRFHRFLCDTVQDFLMEKTDHAYDILILSTPPQHGKLIADDTPVLTTNGWKKHGELKVGDYVYNHKGKAVKVIHIFDKDVADREVIFTNGEKIKCNHNHEWYVYSGDSHKYKTLETKYMEERVSYGTQEKKSGHRYNFQLPIREPIQGNTKELSVAPYVLGAWLGDGTNQKQCICAFPKDIVVLEECSKYYPISSINVHKETGVYTYYYKGLNNDLRYYGMCHNYERTEKHIPQEYLNASYEQRLELLAGLIDTGGSLDKKHNRIVFTTFDIELKKTFEDLIATFGWGTTTYQVEPSLTTSGIQSGKRYWQISFNPTVTIPCKAPRKRIVKFSKQRKISICEINKIEPIQGNCITVEGGIYLVGNTMLPTHNSITVTETLPSWYLGLFPYNKVIEVSYSEDFAMKFGMANNRKIEQFGKEVFGVTLAKKPNTSTEFRLDNNVGGMISRGITSGITGQPADLIIIDDPVKNRQEADSESDRATKFNEWTNSIKTRLSAGAKVILIMTRWHEDDLAGRIIETEKNVKVVNIPCEAEGNDILGREVGDALCPEIGKDNRWLEEFKLGYQTQEGSRAWNALFQGRPTSAEGNMIKREWWQYYETLPEFDEWLMSVDCTFKDADTNDFVAMQVWGKKNADMYLVDRVKKHLNLPDTMREIIRLRSLYPKCKTTLIEDKANGSAVINILRKTLTGIIAVNPIGGKVARVNAVVGAIESGNCYLPKNKPFTVEFVEECSSFPNGKHDDEVDSMSQALNRFIYTRNGGKQTKMPSELELMFPKYSKQSRGNRMGRGAKINVI